MKTRMTTKTRTLRMMTSGTTSDDSPVPPTLPCPPPPPIADTKISSKNLPESD